MATASLDASLAARFRDEFPIFRRTNYLNSCSLGALSRRSRERVNEYLDLWESRGASAWYDVWWAALAELRTRYGEIVGAGEGEIALHPSMSSALSAVAESLDYSERRKVVVASLDFPTVPYQWYAKRALGVEVEVIESPDATTVPLELWERAVDDRTAIVATSHVFYNSGAVQDIGAIAEIAHRRGALCLIDGYHGVGQIPTDVKAADVDFYGSGGLKWLLGGTGVAFLYARPELHPHLRPRVTGWFSDREQFRFDTLRHEWHDDARRLEMGTPPLMPVYAQLGGLEVLAEAGLDRVHEESMALAEDLIERAAERGLRPKVAPRAAERSAIVMVPSEHPHRDVARLADAGIITDARPGHVRISPYFYNVADDHRAALEILTSE